MKGPLKKNMGKTGHTINFSGVCFHVYIVQYQHVESIECYELYEFNLSRSIKYNIIR